MMEDQAVFSIASKCFGPVDEDEWNELTGSPLWSDFLDGARRMVQDARLLSDQTRPTLTIRSYCPLQEFLSVGEVNALFCPPTYAEKLRFAAQHFTGGLPESAVPVESLYEPWMADAQGERASVFSRCEGLYLGDAAGHVRSLISDLGLSLPEAFAACPDHLALELDLLAVLLRSGRTRDARVFLTEHLGWLTAYRMKLLTIGDAASFYIGLVDVLLGIREQRVISADFEQADDPASSALAPEGAACGAFVPGGATLKRVALTTRQQGVINAMQCEACN